MKHLQNEKCQWQAWTKDTMVFLCWTLESFNMSGITTLWTSFFAYKGLFKIKLSFVCWHLLFTDMMLVTGWS